MAVPVAQRGSQLDGVGLGAAELEPVGEDEDLHALTLNVSPHIRYAVTIPIDDSRSASATILRRSPEKEVVRKYELHIPAPWTDLPDTAFERGQRIYDVRVTHQIHLLESGASLLDAPDTFSLLVIDYQVE